VYAVYVAGAVTAVDADDGLPHVALTEMLDELHIADDAIGNSGASMME